MSLAVLMYNNVLSLYLDDTTENLIPCPCNSSERCFSFNNTGIEMCGCFPGYARQIIDGQGNETCTGMFLSNNLITINIIIMSINN